MAYRGLRGLNTGDVWRCPCCHTRNDDGANCEECHATRDGEETQECASCSEHKALDAFTYGTSTCDACLGDDEDIRFFTETQNAA